MKSSEFTRLVRLHGLRGAKSIEACRLLMVGDGTSAYAVAKQLGIAESTISRAMARLRRPVCSHCGQPTKG